MGTCEQTDIGRDNLERVVGSLSSGGSNGGGNQAGGSALKATALSDSEEYIPSKTAMVPSRRLAEETAKKRELLAENKALKARVSELETALKASRNEFVFRRGKRTG
jgi:hypothetical protein